MEELYERLESKAENKTARYLQLEELISSPEVMADSRLFRRFCKEMDAYSEIVEQYGKIKKLKGQCADCQKEYAKAEGELKDIFYEELKKLEGSLIESYESLRASFCADGGEQCAVLEIVAVQGGGKFCLDLAVMYKNFANIYNLSFVTAPDDIIDDTIISRKVEICGYNAYTLLAKESGVHRFFYGDRWETVSVLVMQKTVFADTELKSKDIRIDLFHSSGAGGQNVNKVESAIRVTHLPTGIAVTCQDERSQLKNKERALANLNEKLKESVKEKSDKQYADSRKKLMSEMKNTVRRSYNYSQNTVVDLLSDITTELDRVLKGDIGSILEAVLLDGES